SLDWLGTLSLSKREAGATFQPSRSELRGIKPTANEPAISRSPKPSGGGDQPEPVFIGFIP
ncbi:MAG: hypothetical protein PSV13_08195, partial [Lacunisphaera sp.]|nr:hypothetical protein [Lacunisphaera sp.]